MLTEKGIFFQFFKKNCDHKKKRGLHIYDLTFGKPDQIEFNKHNTLKRDALHSLESTNQQFSYKYGCFYPKQLTAHTLKFTLIKQKVKFFAQEHSGDSSHGFAWIVAETRSLMTDRTILTNHSVGLFQHLFKEKCSTEVCFRRLLKLQKALCEKQSPGCTEKIK